jgi:hypothetical protein
MMVTGALVYAPINCFIYLTWQPFYITKIWPRLLPASFTADFAKNTLKTGILSTLTDRLFTVWPLYVMILFTSGFIGSKFDFDTGVNQVKDKLFLVWVNALKFWTFAQLVCYVMVPFFYRVVADAFFGTIFSII